MHWVRRFRFSHRLALLLAVLALGFLACGIVGYRAYEEVRVGGPVYQDINRSQDLVSDILPPPLYIVEPYLICLQIGSSDDAQQRAVLTERLRRTRAEYAARYTYWTHQHLSDTLNDVLILQSNALVTRFFYIAFEEFVPARERGDARAVRAALTRLTQHYDDHRALIDRAVVQARAEARKRELQATQQLERAHWVVVLIPLAFVALAALIAVIIHRSILTPVEEAVRIAGRVARGDYDVAPEAHHYPDEAGRLLAALHTMAERQRATVENLEEANEELRLAMDHVVQNEKLAAMGGMVAGVAHELNTPLGNALTMSSTLHENVASVTEALDKGELKRTELRASLIRMRDMSELIDRSVRRAAELVSSFKQVAIDQVSERRREFYVRQLIDEHVRAMRPSFPLGDWLVRNQVPAHIQCEGFPGPLGQIITNLVQNAIVHGFEGRIAGSTSFEGRIDGGDIELVVSDDGCGIDPTVLPHVFEPFYTTRMGKGGSGLGLAVSHRIASVILGGSLRVESVPGQGSRFVLRFPPVSPGRV